MRVIAGAAKGKRLKSPVSDTTRPIMDRVKTALFDILAFRIAEKTVLDLFAGVGSVGIEALSRGASHAVFIEMNLPIIRVLRENLANTGFTAQAAVHHSDAFAYIPRAAAARAKFDIIYIAPPQYKGMAQRALRAVIENHLAAPGGLLIVQIHPRERSEFTQQFANFTLTDERTYGSTSLLFYSEAALESV